MPLAGDTYESGQLEHGSVSCGTEVLRAWVRKLVCHEALFRRFIIENRDSPMADPVPLQSIQQTIDALQKSGLLIVVDDENRENEGDFICAAESITPEQVDFMLRIGRGTLCVPVTSEAARLKLRPVVDGSSNTAPNKTAFLRAVDHISAGSGVSALNRSLRFARLARKFR